MEEVDVQAVGLGRLAAMLPPERAARFAAATETARAAFGDRTVWHVSSTAQGGGVAEMLQTLLAYAKGAGIENRWLVLDGDPAFFSLTKRVHNMLHGDPGDGGPLGDDERSHYEAVMRRNLPDLTDCVSARDIVLLHDPQTVGLAAALRATGATVVWRCHVGRDRPNALTDAAWSFLRGYVEQAHALVFSRREYAPEWAHALPLAVIPPSIDPFSPKNMALTPDQVIAVLAQVGLVAGGDPDGRIDFVHRDGRPGTVRPRSLTGGLLADDGPPRYDVPLVVQVSRWDRLKDMAGVMSGFARAVAEDGLDEVHLMLVGPDVSGVSDDPEGARVLAECRAAWQELPSAVRRRVHLVTVPMDDADENAIIVNALQRHATVVVQKSLVEGFGLTVTEAMWKGRPVVASRLGGLQDQISDGVDGLLVDDPRDLDDFAAVLRRPLSDAGLAARLGAAAHHRVSKEYIGDRHLEQYVELFAALLARTREGRD